MRRESNQQTEEKGHIFMLHVSSNNSQLTLPGLRDEDGWIIEDREQQHVKIKFPAYDGKIDFLYG
jgi:hypothetical protein